MKLFKKNSSELELQIAWLDSQDATVRFSRGLVSIEIFDRMDSRRVRKCEGVGMNLFSAIQDARKILREQGATD